MVVRYVLACFIGLLLAGVVSLDFIKPDESPFRRNISCAVNAAFMLGICILSVHFYGFTYRFIIFSMLAVNLLYVSNSDIREQVVSFSSLAVSVFCALAVLIWNKDSLWWVYMISGIGYALLFLLVSRITRSAFGQGDALIIGSIGLYLGFIHASAVLFYAFLIGGIISLILIFMKKVSRQTPLPFAPFLAAGFLVSILL